MQILCLDSETFLITYIYFSGLTSITGINTNSFASTNKNQTKMGAIKTYYIKV